MREKVSREPDTSFQVIFWLWRLCKGHHDSVVDVYQGPYILASVNDMEIYTRTTLSKFTFSYLWGYWLHCCSVHCSCVFILSLSSIFCLTLSVSVLYLQCIGWLIREWSLWWNWWSVSLKILYIFFVLTYYQMYDFHIFFFYCWLSFQTHCTLMQSSL